MKLQSSHLVLALAAGLLLSFTSCRSSQDRSASIQSYAPGETKPETARVLPQALAPKEFPRIPPADPAAAELPAGYRAEVVVRDLTYPSSVVFDDAGDMYVAEAGYSYGDPVAAARILRISPKGDLTQIADQLNGPITGLLWLNGQLYVSHFGKVSIVQTNGAIRDL